jgi:multidrug efflux system membrane fusion protein
MVFVLVGVAVPGCKRNGANATGGPTGSRSTAMTNPVPVIAGTVEKKDVPIFLEGLGTVQAFNTVTVRSRVDGQVVRIAFVEGQEVHAGDLLAQIDPAPFQAQLDQSVAKKAQDEAELSVAQITLKRDEELLAGKILAQQDYDTQKAQVDQLKAAVQADEAAIESARVNLAYASITAPLEGRTGIRLVDQGNIVHATDTTGLVVLTQLRPISIVFTLPEQTLGQIQAQRGAGETLSVYAVDRDNRTTLGEGKLAVIDNQIDTSTGTLRLKATFPNEDLRLWPGQFVNVRLLVTTRKDGTVVPASVVQRGPDGAFAFVLSNDVALVRAIKVALIEQNQALIDDGLVPGERVVVDGQYKLQAGQRVKASVPGAPSAPPSSTRSADAKTPPTSRPPM